MTGSQKISSSLSTRSLYSTQEIPVTPSSKKNYPTNTSNYTDSIQRSASPPRPSGLFLSEAQMRTEHAQICQRKENDGSWSLAQALGWSALGGGVVGTAATLFMNLGKILFTALLVTPGLFLYYGYNAIKTLLNYCERPTSFPRLLDFVAQAGYCGLGFCRVVESAAQVFKIAVKTAVLTSIQYVFAGVTSLLVLSDFCRLIDHRRTFNCAKKCTSPNELLKVIERNPISLAKAITRLLQTSPSDDQNTLEARMKWYVREHFEDAKQMVMTELSRQNSQLSFDIATNSFFVASTVFSLVFPPVAFAFLGLGIVSIALQYINNNSWNNKLSACQESYFDKRLTALEKELPKRKKVTRSPSKLGAKPPSRKKVRASTKKRVKTEDYALISRGRRQAPFVLEGILRA